MTNSIKVTKKTADNLNCFFDDKKSEWLANVDRSVLDKWNEEKQLDDSEILSFSAENRNSNTTTKTKADLCLISLVQLDNLNERRPMEDIPPKELKSLLAHFFIKARKLRARNLNFVSTKFRPLYQLAGFLAPIPPHFVYFLHAFPVNEFPGAKFARTDVAISHVG